MALAIYLAFTAASVVAMIAFTVRMIIDKSPVRSFICMAPMAGLGAHLLMSSLGYPTLALWSLAMAALVVGVCGLIYGMTNIPVDEHLFPLKEQSPEIDFPVTLPQPPILEPTRHRHLRVVSSSRSVP